MAYVTASTVDITPGSHSSPHYPRSPMSDSPGPWRYRLLGGLAVEGADGRVPDLGGRKQRAVLAALLLDLDRAVPADRLIDQVWGDERPAAGRGVAAGLRVEAAAPARARSDPNGAGHARAGHRAGRVPAGRERDDVDLARFDDLRLAATAAQAAGDHGDRGRTRYDEALGPPRSAAARAGRRGRGWPTPRPGSTRSHADVLDGAFDTKLALGGGRELVGDLEAAVAAHPFRERLHGHLALALYRAGRQTDALRSLADARRDAGRGDRRRTRGPTCASSRPTSSPRRHTSTPSTRRPVRFPAIPAAPARTATGTRDDATARQRRRPTCGRRRSPAGRAATRRSRPRGSTLVGRATEIAVLIEAARAGGAAASGGRWSSAASRASARPGSPRSSWPTVAADGFVVAWARCHESAATAPYWGYTQIAEQLLEAGVVSDDARDGISAAGGGVHTIDPGADRPTLHGTMVAALRSTTRPLLLVVDDLQWADASSLRALEFVASSLSAVPVLLVATVRPVMAGRRPGARRLPRRAGPPARLPAHRPARPVAHRRPHVARPARPTADPRRQVARLRPRAHGREPVLRGRGRRAARPQDRLATSTPPARRGCPAPAVDVVRRRVGMLPPATQPLLSSRRCSAARSSSTCSPTSPGRHRGRARHARPGGRRRAARRGRRRARPGCASPTPSSPTRSPPS